ncbi:MAG TPA: hypothetical protein VIG74_01580 [Alphaproteobacteria bacterium]
MSSGKWLLVALCAAMIGLCAASAYAQDKSVVYSKSKAGTTMFTPKKLSGAQHLQVTPEVNFQKRMELVKAQNAINSDMAAQDRKKAVADNIQRMLNDKQKYVYDQRAAANTVAGGKTKAAAKGMSKASPVYNTPAKKKSGEPFKIFNFGKKD